MTFKIIAAAGAACFAVAAATAASAQAINLPATPLGPTTAYGTLGYTFQDRNTAFSPTLGAVTGRLGARFGGFLGVEGEYSYGVDSDQNRGFKSSIENQYAAYGVAYLPLRRNLDLFARLGYGAEDVRLGAVDPAAPLAKITPDGVNYGAGAQWFFRPSEGVRFDYTRYDPTDRGFATADTYGVSYVHRF